VPHRLDVRIGTDAAESRLLAADEKTIVLLEFEPRSRNSLLAQTTQIRVKTEEIVGFTVYRHTFHTELIAEIEWNGQRAYRFEAPHSLDTQQEPFVITPKPRDNVTLTFTLRDIQQFKKVESITQDEIRFSGSFASFRDCFGKVLYNIELKTPFDRPRFSAVFRHAKGDHFILSDFVSDAIFNEAIDRYVRSEFYGDRKLEDIPHEKEQHIDAGETHNRRKRVLLVDDKKVITDIVTEMLQLRTNYLVYATNDSSEVLNLAVENEPDVILLDLNMPGMDGVTVARKLRENRITTSIPIIFMTASHDSTRVKEARELGVSSYLVKPVEFNKLLQTLRGILEQREGADMVLNKRLALLSDDEHFTFEFMAALRDLHMDADTYKYAEELLREAVYDDYGLIIMRLSKKQVAPLTVINALRRKATFESVSILVFPRTPAEANLLRALMDENLIVLEKQVEAATFAANLPSYLN